MQCVFAKRKREEIGNLKTTGIARLETQRVNVQVRGKVLFTARIVKTAENIAVLIKPTHCVGP